MNLLSHDIPFNAYVRSKSFPYPLFNYLATNCYMFQILKINKMIYGPDTLFIFRLSVDEIFVLQPIGTV